MNNKLPIDFDWRGYLDRNPDLISAGFDTEKQAVDHYTNFGHKENRNHTKLILLTPSEFFEKYTNVISNLENDKKRILFINHQESRTGAPLLLKEIIRYEVQKKELDVLVISLSGGDDNTWDEFKNIRYDDIPGKTNIEKCEFIENLIKPNIVYSNTLGSTVFSKYFKCKKIVSIHENVSLRYDSDRINNLKNFDEVLICCEPGKKTLHDNNIESELVPYYLKKNPKEYEFVKDVDFDAPIIGAGTVQIRKGVHRFIEVAKLLPEQKFIWVGSLNKCELYDNKIEIKGENFHIENIIEKEKIKNINLVLDIPSNVEFIGLIDDEKKIIDLFSKSKCFLMLSTDDAFPLVVIESKLLNKNVVNLKNIGDSYKVCDQNDLILEQYDAQEIKKYLENMTPNKTKFNYELFEYLNHNISINRKYYIEMINN